MNNIQYSDHRRFLASIGLALVALSFILPWIVLKDPLPSDSNASTLVGLTTIGQYTFNLRQIISFIIHALLLCISPLSFIVGSSFLMIGVPLWMIRETWQEKQDVEFKRIAQLLQQEEVKQMYLAKQSERELQQQEIKRLYESKQAERELKRQEMQQSLIDKEAERELKKQEMQQAYENNRIGNELKLLEIAKLKKEAKEILQNREIFLRNAFKAQLEKNFPSDIFEIQENKVVGNLRYDFVVHFRDGANPDILIKIRYTEKPTALKTIKLLLTLLFLGWNRRYGQISGHAFGITIHEQIGEGDFSLGRELKETKLRELSGQDFDNITRDGFLQLFFESGNYPWETKKATSQVE